MSQDPLPKILIVDDVPENLISLESILEDLDAEIVKANSGQEALEIVLDSNFALILLDVQMPELNGFETAKFLRSIEKTRYTPIIFLTAIAKEEKYLFEGYEAGAIDFIHKPIDDKILINKSVIFLEMYKQKETVTKLANSSLKFVPNEFLAALGKESIIDIQSNEAVQKNITILFSDIRKFTSISESLSTHDLINFLNDYTECMTPIIHNNKGFIDKFIGDAIMAIFPNANDAVHASVNMHQALIEFNKKQTKLNRPEISIGIGLNYGTVMMGTIGSSTRLETTVIGDSVNIASRLESLTKFYDSNIIISEDTYRHLNDDNLKIRELDVSYVKGKNKSIKLFQVLNSLPNAKMEPIISVLPQYNKGLSLYRNKEFETAITQFKECRSIVPNDHIFQLYIERCEHYIQSPPPENWNGVYKFEHK